MAVEPAERRPLTRKLRLVPFERAYATVVTSWVRTDHDVHWLAPATTPPLTAEKVCGWQGPGRQGFLLDEAEGAEPRGYGELNVLNARRREYWLGHLIIDPALRGRGLGRALTCLLLERAFGPCGARRVSLVVFPDNHAAIACYRSAGMRTEGYEVHVFGARQRRERLLRMAATRFH